jgi:hypothetical protein
VQAPLPLCNCKSSPIDSGLSQKREHVWCPKHPPRKERTGEACIKPGLKSFLRTQNCLLLSPFPKLSLLLSFLLHTYIISKYKYPRCASSLLVQSAHIYSREADAPCLSTKDVFSTCSSLGYPFPYPNVTFDSTLGLF